MSAGKPKAKIRMPARNDRFVMLSKARPKKPLKSPRANHSYLKSFLFMGPLLEVGVGGRGAAQVLLLDLHGDDGAGPDVAEAGQDADAVLPGPGGELAVLEAQVAL